MTMQRWTLDPDRVFGPEPRHRERARALFDGLRQHPLHSVLSLVDLPPLAAELDGASPRPAAQLLAAEPAMLRLLHGLGQAPIELDPAADEASDRQSWKAFWTACQAVAPAFKGTAAWWRLEHVLAGLVELPFLPGAGTADEAYDWLLQRLADPEQRPIAFAQRHRIQTIGVRLTIAEDLGPLKALQDRGLPLRPVLCPDPVTDPMQEGWTQAVATLGRESGVEVDDYAGFLWAIQARRKAFAELGGVSTDQAIPASAGEAMDDAMAAGLYQRLLEGSAGSEEAGRFAMHMVGQMARMSAEDGMTMLLRLAPRRGSGERRSGMAAALQQTMRPLLEELGWQPSFQLVTYGLEQGAVTERLGRLAAQVPALRLGSPWQSADGSAAIHRYLDLTVEAVGVGNLAGFIDQAPGLPALVARHELWRRACCAWLAGQELKGVIDQDDAVQLAELLASGQAARSFQLG